MRVPRCRCRARDRRRIDAQNTIYSVKRIIGQSFRSPRVQEALSHVPYRVVVHQVITWTIADHFGGLVQVLARFLRRLVQLAARFLRGFLEVFARFLQVLGRFSGSLVELAAGALGRTVDAAVVLLVAAGQCQQQRKNARGPEVPPLPKP